MFQVKPQQLHSSQLGSDTSSGSSSVLTDPSAVPSPPALHNILASQQTFQNFQMGTSQLITPEPRVCYVSLIYKFSKRDPSSFSQ